MNSTSSTANRQTVQPAETIRSLVSIIIPAYNQGHYLGAAIESVLAQTYTNFEIIVVDDGSTDDTRQVALSFSQSQVRYFYQENAGLSAARNAGIREARGEYLTYLDSDDLFEPRKLELLVGELTREAQLGFAAGQAVLVDEGGRPLGQVFDTPPPEDTSDLLYWNPFHVGSTMVRRAWQERAGLFDESLRAYEDWDMWLRLARLGCGMGWVAQPVARYRFHTKQMTRDRERMTTATFAVLDKTFSDPHLPDAWRKKKDLAYSNAYLRSAAQAYRSGDLLAGRADLAEAARLDPGLSSDGGVKLARRFAAIADLPKVQDKLGFLERIYANLPDELASLSQKRSVYLSQTATELGFGFYEQGDVVKAGELLCRAVRYDPKLLFNRGVLSILCRSQLARVRSAPDVPPYTR